MKDPGICYLLGTYPQVSTTFIDREIRVLRQWGLEIRLLAMRQPAAQTPLSEEQRSYRQQTVYLVPVDWPSFWAGNARFLLTHFRKYVGTLFYLLSRPHPGLRARWKTALHFAEGVQAAHQLHRNRPRQLHAHFADRVATVALVAGRLLGVPYSMATHARDIYVDTVLLTEIVDEAEFVVVNSEYNRDHLMQRLGGKLGRDSLLLVYNGLDLDTFEPARKPPTGRPLVLAVGRLVEKKGFPYLLRACRRLMDRGYELTCRIVGEGPQRPALEALIAELGLVGTASLAGAMPPESVLEQYRQASVFVLPSIVAQDGDRDGIPNVLMEAMAMRVPVVSTHVSGIPELVQDGINGRLVAPGDEISLAEAIRALLDNPGLGRILAERGRETVQRDFDIQRNPRTLLDRFSR